MQRKFFIRSFGCQMNVYDSRRISGHLEALGWARVDDALDADAVIFNTCYIREKAADKVYSELGRLRLSLNRKPVFAIVGCLAKADGSDVFRRAPFVSIVLSSQKYHLLPSLLERAGDGEKIAELGLDGLDKFDCLPPVSHAAHVEFVQIQEGCDQCCSYCCVPRTRGREKSRPWREVLGEVENLVSLGAVEINLVGQNVNAYDGGVSLASLIRKVAEIRGLRRIRFTTSYPSLMTGELVGLFAAEPKLMPLLYLPMQSGSDAVLEKMNRKYTLAEYFAIVEKMAKVAPRVKFSSDFIVGFPGETDNDFQATLDAVRNIKFIQSFSFRYSPRPNTAAAKMDGQVPLAVKTERIVELQKLLRSCQDEFNKSFVGRETEALFTERMEDELLGRNEYQQMVIVKADSARVGEIRRVAVDRASYANLRGTVLPV
ncbi:MAG: tRNA (N6-isopentenyl adenosine(37)-C2)-methylthiotransferase MiaB [Rickettsiales bacterium]|jgi:tRNA-2-methylthio-N6-dimethylallyladenosine synthase|nr:tRNA (N6-isopentenyl adenosine(37)-C2)-methylthiotransferase MiaB [Rickettsiales bacterium]